MTLPDLRWNYAPRPEAVPGFDPALDAAQMVAPGTESPAAEPVPGDQILDSLGTGHRFVVRIPREWNGDLVVCGTPAMRSEYVNDAIFGDFLLARGYALASSNKGIPYNAIFESAEVTPARELAYPVPFDLAEMRSQQLVVRFGALYPQRTEVRAWHEDLAAVLRASKDHVRRLRGRSPERTYAVGLSIGGGQVRWLLENHPELVDGGLEWAAVFWNPARSVLDALPQFLRHMPTYVKSGYADAAAHDAIVAAGFPPDRLQDDPWHTSLWDDHYSNQLPFYADLTTFVFAHLIDPQARSSFDTPLRLPNPVRDDQAASNAGGLALPAARAAYVPSPSARREIERFAQTGRLERPLVGIAGGADVFVTPQLNAYPYLEAVRAAGRSDRYWQYIVEGGTHVDAFCAFGYGLQPQLPFAWAAFDLLIGIVEDGARPPGAGTSRLVQEPEDLFA